MEDCLQANRMPKGYISNGEYKQKSLLLARMAFDYLGSLTKISDYLFVHILVEFRMD